MKFDNSSLVEILDIFKAEQPLGEEHLKILESQELIDQKRAEVFNINSTNVKEVVMERSLLFRSVINDYDKIPIRDNHTLENLWKLWLPLGIKLAQKYQDLGRPLVQGILGGQGTGKTTLAKILVLILNKLGYNTVSISIDDLYKTYAERQLLQQQDSRLIWRGPPGTHDVSLGIEVLDKLRQFNHQNSDNLIAIPRFNKSLFNGAGDRIKPEMVSKVDIILFEGWFVGVRPISEKYFDFPPPPIITEADKQFARDMNQKLMEYLPLWQILDSLIVLYPSDYRFSKQWRKEAEQKMINSGKSGMSDEQIDKFVEYFWQALHPELFIKPLIKNSKFVDLVIEMNADRSLGKIYNSNFTEQEI